MRGFKIVATLVCGLTVAGCGHHPESAHAVSTPKPSAASALQALTGSTKLVETVVSGSGQTQELATINALRMAAEQVNGVTLKDVGIESRLGVGSDGNGGIRLTEHQSQGLIDHFKVKTVTPPAKQGDDYSVTLDAFVRKYQAPSADAEKLKLVVANVIVPTTGANIAGIRVSAIDLSSTLTGRVVDQLSSNPHFIVLSRADNQALAKELDLIQSGDTASSAYAKLGQAYSADLILVTNVTQFSYDRYARKLDISDHPLVNYSGGWQVEQKLINVATRAIVESKTLSGALPHLGPSTLPLNVDPNKLIASSERAMADGVSSQVVQSLFPSETVSTSATSVAPAVAAVTTSTVPQQAAQVQRKTELPKVVHHPHRESAKQADSRSQVDPHANDW